MKFFTVFVFAAFAAGCANTERTVQNTTNSATTSANTPRGEKIDSAIAHTTENQPPKPSNAQSANPSGQSKWTQSGDPIDTTALDAAIMAAEKTLTSKSGDPAAKKALGEAYFKRAVALTDARQYASALGDYRRTLKHDPSNAEAKDWIERIVSIYSSINRSYPAEGEEPPPLPFKKG
ncbi:MAG TPA: tetratricopeptide repeat protein [Pyrinomonadaceae bacterium]|nr:tetratricopeptide repeat protein [Pyrinomonadaceae bacterium]